MHMQKARVNIYNLSYIKALISLVAFFSIKVEEKKLKHFLEPLITIMFLQVTIENDLLVAGGFGRRCLWTDGQLDTVLTLWWECWVEYLDFEEAECSYDPEVTWMNGTYTKCSSSLLTVTTVCTPTDRSHSTPNCPVSIFVLNFYFILCVWLFCLRVGLCRREDRRSWN